MIKLFALNDRINSSRPHTQQPLRFIHQRESMSITRDPLRLSSSPPFHKWTGVSIGGFLCLILLCWAVARQASDRESLLLLFGGGGAYIEEQPIAQAHAHVSEFPNRWQTSVTFRRYTYPHPAPLPQISATMQWDEQCFDLLYATTPSNDTAIMEHVCHCTRGPTVTTPMMVDPAATSRTLSLSIPPAADDAAASGRRHSASQVLCEGYDGTWLLTVASLPAILSAVVHSTAPPCADVLDVTLFELRAGPAAPAGGTGALPVVVEGVENADPSSPEIAESSQGSPYRATPATVVARADGTYAIAAPVFAEGVHDLQVG